MLETNSVSGPVPVESGSKTTGPQTNRWERRSGFAVHGNKSRSFKGKLRWCFVTDAPAPGQAELDRARWLADRTRSLSLDCRLTKSGRVAVRHARRANSRPRSRPGQPAPSQPAGWLVRPPTRLPGQRGSPSGYPAVQSRAADRHGIHGEHVRSSSSGPPCQARHQSSRATGRRWGAWGAFSTSKTSCHEGGLCVDCSLF